MKCPCQSHILIKWYIFSTSNRSRFLHLIVRVSLLNDMHRDSLRTTIHSTARVTSNVMKEAVLQEGKRNEERCMQEEGNWPILMGPPKFNTLFSSISPPRRLGRPNQYPIHDRQGRASPPIPLLWPKTESFRNRPNLGRFLASDPNWVAKTPHGYLHSTPDFLQK